MSSLYPLSRRIASAESTALAPAELNTERSVGRARCYPGDLRRSVDGFSTLFSDKSGE